MMRILLLLSLGAHLAIAAAGAQTPAPVRLPLRVRFVVTTGGAEWQWTGQLEAFTRDSLAVRPAGSNRLYRFARSDVRQLERWRSRSVGKAVAAGCLALGGLFGFFALGTSDEPDALIGGGAAVVFGLVAGCAVGGIGGLAIGAAQRAGWESLTLPDG
jgi:hypothetical protein